MPATLALRPPLIDNDYTPMIRTEKPKFRLGANRYFTWPALMLCAGLLWLASAPGLAAQKAFVGAQKCAQCHRQQYQQWRQSHHYQAMQPATAAFVLGDFNNRRLAFHGVTSRFFQQAGKYYVETLGDGDKAQIFAIKYTFGFYPLQQYLIELDDGFIQALNIAWDSRPQEEGGQRWYHLRAEEDMSQDHPFYWTRHFQNWNGRCAHCHSTNVSKNYDAENHRFATTWSEVNVACEACHGPGSEHLARLQSGRYAADNSGFSGRKAKPLVWQFAAAAAVAEPQGEKSERHIDMCGSCHALRTQLEEDFTGAKFHDANLLQLPLPPNYFADGQIREEVFVMGSFLQSKMHAKGVSCMNCHNPHSNQLLVEGNDLCAQCHNVQIFDTPKHHRHKATSAGALCVNCHMPERTYMGVDRRRDHSFTIPRPDLSRDLGLPNACTQCHADEDNDWASAALKAWGVNANADHWAYINDGASRGDATFAPALAHAIARGDLPSAVEAGLLSHFSAFPSQAGVQVARAKLQHGDALVRRAAVTALEAVPVALRWQILADHLDDASDSVRFEIARVLAAELRRLAPAQRDKLSALLAEYRQVLEVSADAPATQLAIANLELALGNEDGAQLAYRRALRIEPAYVPALINFADFHRRAGREAQVEALLQNALRVAPESGGAQHSYGLYLVRRQQYRQALPHLEAAVSAEDALPRYAYVYAVALDNQNATDKAIEVLSGANQRWPHQYDILMTLVLYLEKAGKTFAIPKYVEDLREIAPQAPEVQRLVKKYRG